jgi:hypothetical protein
MWAQQAAPVPVADNAEDGNPSGGCPPTEMAAALVIEALAQWR